MLNILYLNQKPKLKILFMLYPVKIILKKIEESHKATGHGGSGKVEQFIKISTIYSSNSNLNIY